MKIRAIMMLFFKANILFNQKKRTKEVQIFENEINIFDLFLLFCCLHICFGPIGISVDTDKSCVVHILLLERATNYHFWTHFSSYQKIMGKAKIWTNKKLIVSSENIRMNPIRENYHSAYLSE